MTKYRRWGRKKKEPGDLKAEFQGFLAERPRGAFASPILEDEYKTHTASMAVQQPLLPIEVYVASNVCSVLC